MSGALGTVVLAGVASGVLSVSGFVEVVPVSASFSGAVTTAGVGEAGVLTSVSVSFTGGRVLIIAIGVSEMVVPSKIGVEARVSSSILVSFSGVVTRMGVAVVIGRVDIELVVIMKVCVTGTVLGVSLIVTTVLVTG